MSRGRTIIWRTGQRRAAHLALFALVAPLVAFAVPAAAVETHFEASLSPESVVPPADSGGYGRVELTFDDDSYEVIWIIRHQDLSGPVTSVTLHGPSASGENAPELVSLVGDLGDPILGGSTLSRANAGYLLDGLVYIVIATEAFPEGEIRGQLVATGTELGGADED